MSVVLLESGLEALLNSPAGPIGIQVRERAEAIAGFARENVQANFATRTGNLFNSIGVFPTETGLPGTDYEVGTDGAPYGLLLEQGNDVAHEIVAINGKLLSSLSDNPNPLKRPKFAVPHYGYPPRPWLKPACYTAGFVDG